MADWQGLADRLERATGSDPQLDSLVAEAFAVPQSDYTGSLDAVRGLVTAALPGWKLHIGFDATGVLPYAALTGGDVHVEARSATLPLAVLRVAVAAARQAKP